MTLAKSKCFLELVDIVQRLDRLETVQKTVSFRFDGPSILKSM